MQRDRELLASTLQRGLCAIIQYVTMASLFWKLPSSRMQRGVLGDGWPGHLRDCNRGYEVCVGDARKTVKVNGPVLIRHFNARDGPLR